VAETYGKVIISEINVPVEHKTIKPISIGGQAGGEKYIAQGILFKYPFNMIHFVRLFVQFFKFHNSMLHLRWM
jgi:hypothetical protein